MPYCMYLRKSRADLEAEAQGEGETLARHEKTLLDLAVRMDIPISPDAIYREIVSGETIATRPVMQHVLAEVEQGVWQGVFVMEVERLARGDTIDQGIVAQAFKYSQTKIVTPVKTYDPSNEFDEEYFEFGLFMSRREYKTINRRLQQGREMSVREGKYPGNIAPYGYERLKLEREKGWTLTPHPDESKIVKLIYEWFTGPERLGVTLIGRRLNAMSVPVRKGDSWTDMTVRSVLTNPIYAGMVRWGGRRQVKRVVKGEVIKSRPRAKDYLLFPGRHEALVDKEIFERAQEIFAKNAHTPIPGGRELQNPLAGIVKCGICGRNMVRRPYVNGVGTPDALMCVGPNCPTTASYLYLVENKLLKALEDWLKRYQIKHTAKDYAKNDTEVETLQEAIERLDTQIAVLQKQMDSLHDFLEQGVYSVATFMDRSAVVKEKMDEAQSGRVELNRQLTEATGPIKDIVPRIERIIESYKSLDDPKTKNTLLKEAIVKAVYIKPPENRGKPGAFRLKVYPRLPQ